MACAEQYGFVTVINGQKDIIILIYSYEANSYDDSSFLYNNLASNGKSYTSVKYSSGKHTLWVLRHDIRRFIASFADCINMICLS
jgi:hypothetical protein